MGRGTIMVYGGVAAGQLSSEGMSDSSGKLRTVCTKFCDRTRTRVMSTDSYIDNIGYCDELLR